MSIPVYESVGHSSGGIADSITITAPSGIADNDVLIVAAYVETNTEVWDTVPTGFTSFARIENTGYSFAIEFFWKRAASEAGNYSFTANGSGWTFGSCARFSGCITTDSPIDVVGADATGNSGTPTASGVTTLTADTLLCYMHTTGDGTAGTAPDGMTERFDSQNNFLATLDFPSAGATGNKQGTTTSGQWAAVLFALKGIPEVGGGTTILRQMIAHHG